jgi:hypothetical protein
MERWKGRSMARKEKDQWDATGEHLTSSLCALVQRALLRLIVCCYALISPSHLGEIHRTLFY